MIGKKKKSWSIVGKNHTFLFHFDDYLLPWGLNYEDDFRFGNSTEHHFNRLCSYTMIQACIFHHFAQWLSICCGHYRNFLILLLFFHTKLWIAHEYFFNWLAGKVYRIVRRLPGRRALVVVFIKNMLLEIITFKNMLLEIIAFKNMLLEIIAFVVFECL